MNRVRNNKLAIVIFILPAAWLFLGIIIVPIFLSSYYSLLDWDGISEPTFIGLKNYVEIFTSSSIGFPKSVANVLLLAALSLVVQLPISLLLAIVLANGVKGERFFLSVFFIPNLISTVVTGQLWMKIYNYEYGLLNLFLRAIGLESLTRIWLGDTKTALGAVFVAQLWQYIGYNMLLLYAGIKSQSQEVREAARIDGAGEWRILAKIVLPMSTPIIATLALLVGLGYWNDWLNGLYYINNDKLYSIQVLLNKMLLDVQYLMSGASGGALTQSITLPATGIKMAVAVMGALPILVVYPFFQKYFVKGIVIGAVKG